MRGWTIKKRLQSVGGGGGTAFPEEGKETYGAPRVEKDASNDEEKRTG